MEKFNFDSLEILKTKKGVAEKDYMKHLPKPLSPQETVWKHPDQTGIITERFLRIIHSDKTSVSVFSSVYFE
jgi:hypothetical protein